MKLTIKFKSAAEVTLDYSPTSTEELLALLNLVLSNPQVALIHSGPRPRPPARGAGCGAARQTTPGPSPPPTKGINNYVKQQKQHPSHHPHPRGSSHLSPSYSRRDQNFHNQPLSRASRYPNPRRVRSRR